MSLLMDALKRAEENKQDAARAITRSDRSTPAGLSLEPLPGEPAPASPPTSLPDLADHIDALDADLAATPTTPLPAASQRTAAAAPPPSAAPAPAPDAAREAVRNAFAAKSPAAEEPSRRNLWLILGAGGVAAAVIAGYFWYQLAALSGSSLGRAPAPTAQPPKAIEQPRPAAATAPVAQPYAPPPAYAPLQSDTQAAPPSAALFPPPRPAEPPPTAAASAEPAPAAPIRLKRTPPQVDPNVSRGYANLQGSTLEAARRDYEQALRNDPRNVDALLALAAIAQRQGQAAEAERYQQRAYEADPKDPAAQAAVIGSAASDPVTTESRLKTLLAAQPESGPLNFALGNLYSRQNRWAEAQQVYFTAVTADGDNPDYLFNLAVSLDHLRQPKLAAQHYRLALEAAEKRPAAFDRERVQRRLRDLQP